MRHKTTQAIGEKGKLGSLRLLRDYLLPYRTPLACMLLALLITSASVLGLGKGLAFMVDKGFREHNRHILDLALLLLISMTLVLAFATFARYYFVTMVGERVIADIRKQAYTHLLSLSPDYFDQTRTGDILSRLTNDTTLLQTAVGSSVSIALRNGLLLVGGMAMLIITSPKLTTYIAFVVPCVVLPILWFGRKVRTLSRLTQDKVAELNSRAEQGIMGIKVIQSYTQEPLEASGFNTDVESSYNVAMQRVMMRGILTAIVIILIFGAIAFVLRVGGHDVIAGTMSAGDLSSFIFYAIVVASAVGALSDVAGTLQRAGGATERLFELLNTQPTIQDPEFPHQLPIPVLGRIHFQHVCFTYPTHPNKPVLHDVSFTLEPGQHVALVGPSGSGKSTCFQLMLRFYDVTGGSIGLDGVDIRNLHLTSLRHHFAYVPQDAVIFSTSALENIRFSRPEASDEEVIEALRQAQALEFLEKLPQGIRTELGERGLTLSGGQKQRLSIARAILKNPRILLLDEATSSLDAENEQLVQKALTLLMKDRTTLVIAHRLATVLAADNIIVLHDGRIETMGTHRQLMDTSPLYSKLAALQFTNSH